MRLLRQVDTSLQYDEAFYQRRPILSERWRRCADSVCCKDLMHVSLIPLGLKVLSPKLISVCGVCTVQYVFVILITFSHIPICELASC